MPSHVKNVKNKYKPLKKPPNKMTNKEMQDKIEEEAAEPVKTMENAKVLVVEQEIKIARLLAGNDAKVRNRVLKNLKKWLKLRSKGSFAFSDSDFLRLWKGLWYCMWMSDKPLIQEKLAEDLSQLIHCFDDPKVCIQFFGNFLATMYREWFGIDQWRMDKFMMLVRRIFRQLLFKLQEHKWETELMQYYGEWLDKTVYNEAKSPVGLTMHFNDLYLEEISKVTEGQIDESDVHALLEPCVVFFAKSKDLRHIKHVKRNIFHNLMMQSELGQDYQEKFDIWKRASFPCTDINDLEVNVEVQEESDDNESNDDEENNDKDDIENGDAEKEFDVRAGRVNVVLNEIKFNPDEIINLFEKYRFKEFTNAKSRKNIKELIQKFRRFANGEFPLGIQQMPTVQDVVNKFEKFDPDEKAQELMDYQEELTKKTVYMPPRLKRKLEWKQKLLANGVNGKTENEMETNEWVEEENDENELPKKKKQKKEKVKQNKDEKIDKKSKKQKNPSLNKEKTEAYPSESEKEKKALNLMKQWAKQAKDEDSTAKLKKLNKSIEKSPEEETEPSTPVKSKSLVLNPFAAASTSKKNNKTQSKEKLKGKGSLLQQKTPPNKNQQTYNFDSSEKRVKIALNKNMVQEKHEYIEAVKNSPVPYDSSKKPIKGLLKPNLLPSPINPFYKKRIGLKFNDTL